MNATVEQVLVPLSNHVCPEIVNPLEVEGLITCGVTDFEKVQSRVEI